MVKLELRLVYEGDIKVYVLTHQTAVKAGVCRNFDAVNNRLCSAQRTWQLHVNNSTTNTSASKGLKFRSST